MHLANGIMGHGDYYTLSDRGEPISDDAVVEYGALKISELPPPCLIL